MDDVLDFEQELEELLQEDDGESTLAQNGVLPEDNATKLDERESEPGMNLRHSHSSETKENSMTQNDPTAKTTGLISIHEIASKDSAVNEKKHRSLEEAKETNNTETSASNQKHDGYVEKLNSSVEVDLKTTQHEKKTEDASSELKEMGANFHVSLPSQASTGKPNTVIPPKTTNSEVLEMEPKDPENDPVTPMSTDKLHDGAVSHTSAIHSNVSDPHTSTDTANEAVPNIHTNSALKSVQRKLIPQNFLKSLIHGQGHQRLHSENAGASNVQPKKITAIKSLPDNLFMKVHNRNTLRQEAIRFRYIKPDMNLLGDARNWCKSFQHDGKVQSLYKRIVEALREYKRAHDDASERYNSWEADLMRYRQLLVQNCYISAELARSEGALRDDLSFDAYEEKVLQALTTEEKKDQFLGAVKIHSQRARSLVEEYEWIKKEYEWIKMAKQHPPDISNMIIALPELQLGIKLNNSYAKRLDGLIDWWKWEFKRLVDVKRILETGFATPQLADAWKSANERFKFGIRILDTDFELCISTFNSRKSMYEEYKQKLLDLGIDSFFRLNFPENISERRNFVQDATPKLARQRRLFVELQELWRPFPNVEQFSLEEFDERVKSHSCCGNLEGPLVSMLSIDFFEKRYQPGPLGLLSAPATWSSAVEEVHSPEAEVVHIPYVQYIIRVKRLITMLKKKNKMPEKTVLAATEPFCQRVTNVLELSGMKTMEPRVKFCSSTVAERSWFKIGKRLKANQTSKFEVYLRSNEGQFLDEGKQIPVGSNLLAFGIEDGDYIWFPQHLELNKGMDQLQFFMECCHARMLADKRPIQMDYCFLIPDDSSISTPVDQTENSQIPCEVDTMNMTEASSIGADGMANESAFPALLEQTTSTEVVNEDFIVSQNTQWQRYLEGTIAHSGAPSKFVPDSTRGRNAAALPLQSSLAERLGVTTTAEALGKRFDSYQEAKKWFTDQAEREFAPLRFYKARDYARLTCYWKKEKKCKFGVSLRRHMADTWEVIKFTDHSCRQKEVHQQVQGYGQTKALQIEVRLLFEERLHNTGTKMPAFSDVVKASAHHEHLISLDAFLKKHLESVEKREVDIENDFQEQAKQLAAPLLKSDESQEIDFDFEEQNRIPNIENPPKSHAVAQAKDTDDDSCGPCEKNKCKSDESQEIDFDFEEQNRIPNVENTPKSNAVAQAKDTGDDSCSPCEKKKYPDSNNKCIDGGSTVESPQTQSSSQSVESNENNNFESNTKASNVEDESNLQKRKLHDSLDNNSQCPTTSSIDGKGNVQKHDGNSQSANTRAEVPHTTTIIDVKCLPDEKLGNMPTDITNSNKDLEVCIPKAQIKSTTNGKDYPDNKSCNMPKHLPDEKSGGSPNDSTQSDETCEVQIPKALPVSTSDGKCFPGEKCVDSLKDITSCNETSKVYTPKAQTTSIIDGKCLSDVKAGDSQKHITSSTEGFPDGKHFLDEKSVDSPKDVKISNKISEVREAQTTGVIDGECAPDEKYGNLPKDIRNSNESSEVPISKVFFTSTTDGKCFPAEESEKTPKDVTNLIQNSEVCKPKPMTVHINKRGRDLVIKNRNTDTSSCCHTLQDKDIVISINGHEHKEGFDMNAFLQNIKPGTKLKVKVRRRHSKIEPKNLFLPPKKDEVGNLKEKILMESEKYQHVNKLKTERQKKEHKQMDKGKVHQVHSNTIENTSKLKRFRLSEIEKTQKSNSSQNSITKNNVQANQGKKDGSLADGIKNNGSCKQQDPQKPFQFKGFSKQQQRMLKAKKKTGLVPQASSSLKSHKSATKKRPLLEGKSIERQKKRKRKKMASDADQGQSQKTNEECNDEGEQSTKVCSKMVLEWLEDQEETSNIASKSQCSAQRKRRHLNGIQSTLSAEKEDVKMGEDRGETSGSRGRSRSKRTRQSQNSEAAKPANVTIHVRTPTSMGHRNEPEWTELISQGTVQRTPSQRAAAHAHLTNSRLQEHTPLRRKRLAAPNEVRIVRCSQQQSSQGESTVVIDEQEESNHDFNPTQNQGVETQPSPCRRSQRLAEKKHLSANTIEEGKAEKAAEQDYGPRRPNRPQPRRPRPRPSVEVIDVIDAEEEYGRISARSRLEQVDADARFARMLQAENCMEPRRRPPQPGTPQLVHMTSFLSMDFGSDDSSFDPDNSSTTDSDNNRPNVVEIHDSPNLTYPTNIPRASTRQRRQQEGAPVTQVPTLNQTGSVSTRRRRELQAQTASPPSSLAMDLAAALRRSGPSVISSMQSMMSGGGRPQGRGNQSNRRQPLRLSTSRRISHREREAASLQLLHEAFGANYRFHTTRGRGRGRRASIGPHLVLPPHIPYDFTANDYEMLSRLDENIQQPNRGASAYCIAQMPVSKVTSDQNLGTCSICLCKMEEGEEVMRLLCLHAFHSECIVPWLKTNRTCPIDKEDMESLLQS